MSKTRSTVPLALSTVTGLAAATLMFVLPGEAAPTPSAFAGEASGDVWKINKLDLDMSGDPVAVGLDVGIVLGQTGSVAAPERSRAGAHNLNAATQPAGRRSAQSVATSTNDTVGTTTASGAAGTVPNVLTYGTSVLSARGRWGGDTTCLTPETALTQSKAASQATGIVPAAIPAGTPPLLPVPVPTEVPTEVPTALPSDFPTELPTDLPTILPTPTSSTTLPTDIPTTVLPTLTGSTSILPTLTDATTLLPTLPTATLPLRPADAAQRAEGDISMLQVAPASIEERTLLEAIPGSTTHRRVTTEVVGRLVDASKPAATFFGGEATLKMVGAPTLSAYSDGGPNGSQVTWTPPQMSLTVAGQDFAVPTDGTALALPYSQNQEVVLTVSAGKPTTGESANGTQAQAVVTTLNVIIKRGSELVLDAQLFPMSVKAVAPQGGVDCTPPVVAPISPKLKVTGKNNGAKPDNVRLNAIVDAVGAKATVFKLVHGDRKKVAAGSLNAKGDRRFKIKDKNGKKPTQYLVKIKPTEATKADRDTTRLR